MMTETCPLLQPMAKEAPCVNRTLCAASSALLFIVGVGMVNTYSAPATVDMNRKGSRFDSVSSEQIAWIASITSLTAIVGNVLSGKSDI